MIPKLTPTQVQQIRTLHNKYRYTSTQLARMFKVTPTTISRIVNNKTWRQPNETRTA